MNRLEPPKDTEGYIMLRQRDAPEAVHASTILQPSAEDVAGVSVIQPGQVPRRSKWLGSTGRREQAKAAGR